MLLELAVFNPASVEIAEKCGLERIELCRDYASGGLSPDMAFFTESRRKFSSEVFVMIRPRPGDFFYNETELLRMRELIRQYDDAGADGFVLGCLKDQVVDVISLNMLVEVAGNKPVTFHRAIDLVDEYEAGIQSLIACGCSRVLSSGKAASAPEGAETISRMAEKYGRQIAFLAGGGIRSHNAGILSEINGLKEIHSACIACDGQTADEEEVLRLLAAIA
jgi:copper homeostasis protein